MIWARIRVIFRQVFDILPQTDEQGTIKEIYDNIPVRGNNTWMLMCSAMLASIGLDVNSAAVIIGAMLISPLMSPILGVGLSIGINDREMLAQSLRNLSIATAAALGVSCLYFLISPFAEPTNELLARTTPTLLDVGVAFFGGMAGIISISRSDKSIAIPGVAIATALMPPLCTAGFGLATADWKVFFGAFYLFFINAVFISLATFIIVKYLNFEVKQYLDEKREKQVTRLMALFVFLVSVPSVYFLYNVYANLRDKTKIETLIISDLAKYNYEILKWNIQDNDSVALIKVYSVGKRIRSAEIEKYQKLLPANNLDKYRLAFVQLDIPPEELQKVTIDITSTLLKTFEAQAAQRQLEDTLRARRHVGEFKNELQMLFPELAEIYIETPFPAAELNEPDSMIKVTVRWKPEKEKAFLETKKIRDLVKMRMKPDTVALIMLPATPGDTIPETIPL